ncbi:MAG: PAS domain S-box protein [Desulfarculus sp.]|nr:PAS domain S-box protein [Desulfarculus sp.]
MTLGRAPWRQRIIWAIALPVLVVGLAVGFLANQLLAPPLMDHLQENIDGQLRMASGMGLTVCDNLLDQILSRRLEDSQEVLASMKRGALAEIRELSHQFPNLAVLVLDQNGQVLLSSLRPGQAVPKLDLGQISDGIILTEAQGQGFRLHRRYFPFWRWNIISLISQESSLAPSRMAARTVYLGTVVVLLTVLATLLAAFHWRVKRPLTQIIEATREVSQGRFAPLPPASQDELGQVAGAFNSMVASLEQSRRQVQAVLARLGESEEQYRTLTENAMALITIVQNGRFVFANRMMLERTGYGREQIIGRRAWDLVHPDDRERLSKKDAGPEAGEPGEDHYEFRFLTAEGQ